MAKSSSKKIWLTRPIDDSEHVARELEAAGIACLIAPVKRIVRQPFARPMDAPDAILITSRHAAYALAELPREWREVPVYCVGPATAEYVQEYDFRNMIPGSADILALLPRLGSEIRRGGHLLYLAGEDRRIDVPTLMHAREIKVTTIIAYRAAAETILAPTLVEALSNNSVGSVAFFSPRSAEVAIELLQHAKLAHLAEKLTAFCFSLNVAKSAASLSWHAVHVCASPTRAAMTDLIISNTLVTQ